jgi:hypothetical protein
MTDADRELERLFAVTRAATEPDSGARARVRAEIAARLAGHAEMSEPRAASKSLWLGLGAAIIGVGAVLLLTSPKPEAAKTVPLARPTSSEATLIRSIDAAPLAQPPRSPSPVASESVAPRASSSNSASSSRKPLVGSPGDAGDEIALIRAMQQALRSSNATQALALASEHARRFPNGALREEREGGRAIARCQLAEPAARRAIFEDFVQHFSASPYAARAKAACQ